ncbi:MAG: helix-turn-helix domain-containing protein [bacterium]|nr:helix-turn-helix domain-containing protein [bacterium]
MMKRAVFSLLFVCIIIQPLFAAPIFELADYDTPLDLSGIESILVQKGDSPLYAKPDFDDEDWNRVSLPSNWNSLFPDWDKICWYRFHVKFPEKLPAKMIGLRLGVICDVDEVYFNGALIGKTGEFSPERKSAYDKIRVYEIPTVLIRPGTDNVIAVRIGGLFSKINGPYVGKYTIAPFQKIQRDLFLDTIFKLFFVALYIAVSLYFLLFFLRYTIAKEFLAFSLYTFGSAQYFFLRTQLKFYITDNFLLMKKLEYILIFLLFVLIMAFITYFFRKKHTLLHYIYYAITGISLFIVIVTNNIVTWYDILKYIVQPSWSIPIIYCLWVLFKNFRTDRDARYLLSAFSILFFTIINDILVDRDIYSFSRLTNYGFVVLILSITLIVHNRFIRLKTEFDDMVTKKEKEKEKERLKANSITPDVQKKLDEVMDIIQKNATSDITRDTIAKEVSINPDYLGKMFKKQTGKRINDYINECRVEQAKKMLLEDENSVINIAYAVGFESLPTFYRVFQKITGASPSNYKLKKKENHGDEDS